MIFKSWIFFIKIFLQKCLAIFSKLDVTRRVFMELKKKNSKKNSDFFSVTFFYQIEIISVAF
jgi:hypothetical protein